MAENMRYQGFIGSVETDFDENMLHGQVLFTQDLITYDGETLSELEANFHSAVDQYLALCREHKKDPMKSMSGSFNCRVGPRLHYELVMLAAREGRNMNSIIIEAVSQYINWVTVNPCDFSHVPAQAQRAVKASDRAYREAHDASGSHKWATSTTSEVIAFQKAG